MSNCKVNILDIIIDTEDGKQMRCHSSVIQERCEFSECLESDFSKKIFGFAYWKNDIGNIYPKYLLKEILVGLNIIYYENYVIPELKPTELMMVFKLIDILSVKNRQNIEAQIQNLFEKQLSRTFWLKNKQRILKLNKREKKLWEFVVKKENMKSKRKADGICFNENCEKKIKLKN